MGEGRVFYADSGKLYRQTWDKSGCSLDSVFEGQGDGVRPTIPPPRDLPAAMAFDVRRLGVLPEQIAELHPLLALLLPGRIADAVSPYLPGEAGTAIMSFPATTNPGPWLSLAVFFGYAAASVLAAIAVVRRRDA